MLDGKKWVFPWEIVKYFCKFEKQRENTESYYVKFIATSMCGSVCIIKKSKLGIHTNISDNRAF